MFLPLIRFSYGQILHYLMVISMFHLIAISVYSNLYEYYYEAYITLRYQIQRD